MEGEGIEIVFDYTDPGSYLTWALLDRWGGAGSPRWVPLELRPLPAPLQDPDDPAWNEMTAALAEVADVEGFGLLPPRFVPRTRKAHELAFMAREKGCFDSVHAALFEAHFQGGLDIGRIDVLVRLGGAAGMEGAEVRTVLGVDRFLPEVDRARAAARAREVRGVPTLLSGGERLEGFRGVRELERFLARAGGEDHDHRRIR